MSPPMRKSLSDLRTYEPLVAEPSETDDLSEGGIQKNFYGEKGNPSYIEDG